MLLPRQIGGGRDGSRSPRGRSCKNGAPSTVRPRLQVWGFFREARTRKRSPPLSQVRGVDAVSAGRLAMGVADQVARATKRRCLQVPAEALASGDTRSVRLP